MKRTLLTLALAAITLPATAQTPAPAAAPTIQNEATPALWQIKGPHATLYLFGTIHAMKKEVHWDTPKLLGALDSSSTLYLEITELDQSSAEANQPEMLQLGTDPTHPLSTKIPKPDVDLLDAALKTLGLPGEQAFEPMQPWLAYLTISILPMVQAGYDPTSGIDLALQKEAKASDISVKGLETFSQQLHYMADIPTALQVQMLHQALVDLPKSTAQVNDLVANWTHGDVEAIAKMTNDEMKTKYPDLYKLLLVDRNQRFADQITTMLKAPDAPVGTTTFIAIGAAHLVGPDSVLALLEKRGFPATRVQ